MLLSMLMEVEVGCGGVGWGGKEVGRGRWERRGAKW